jgi:hypothetical protein
VNDHPTPYDERQRLAVIIADARAALAGGCDYDRTALAVHCGRLEALLTMACDSAERVAGLDAANMTAS